MLLLRWSYDSQTPFDRPFVQADWLAPARVPLPLQSDVYAIPALLAAQPFAQTDWPRPWDPRKATGEALGTLSPLLTPNPAQPFSLEDWPRPGDPRKAIGEVVGTLNALLTPNPVQPFAENDWFQISPPQKAIIDVSAGPLLALYFPGQPFSQDDWPLPYRYTLTYSDRGVAYGLNPNITPPAPPPSTVPLFTVSGPSVIDLFPTLVGVVYAEASGGFPHVVSRRTATGLGTPANGYVLENGTTFYVAEDGATFYVQEH